MTPSWVSWPKRITTKLVCLPCHFHSAIIIVCLRRVRIRVRMRWKSRFSVFVFRFPLIFCHRSVFHFVFISCTMLFRSRNTFESFIWFDCSLAFLPATNRFYSLFSWWIWWNKMPLYFSISFSFAIVRHRCRVWHSINAFDCLLICWDCCASCLKLYTIAECPIPSMASTIS